MDFSFKCPTSFYNRPSFLEEEYKSESNFPTYFTFSNDDFSQFAKEAQQYYTKVEIDQVKFALCNRALDYPDIFPNLDATVICGIN